MHGRMSGFLAMALQPCRWKHQEIHPTQDVRTATPLDWKARAGWPPRSSGGSTAEPKFQTVESRGEEKA